MMNGKITRLKQYFEFLKRKYFSQELDKLNDAAHLLNKYGTMVSADQKHKFKQEEYRVYSQNGEDGILLYIFSRIGTTNKTTVEFGVGDGTECNAANLILNFGWNGLFMEGNQRHVDKGQKYYINKGIDSLKFECSFVSAENINDLISGYGFTGEVDLLSVDIDGNDYWVWQQIEVIKPRVVVVEYNSSFGPNRSVTVPYDPTFKRREQHRSGWYHGASVGALEKLGRKKGYELVACDSTGVNAFFIDERINVFEPVPAHMAYYPEFKRISKGGDPEKQLETIGGLELVEV